MEPDELSSRQTEEILRKTDSVLSGLCYQIVATLASLKKKNNLVLVLCYTYLGQRKVHCYESFQDIKNEIKTNERKTEIQFMDLKSL